MTKLQEIFDRQPTMRAFIRERYIRSPTLDLAIFQEDRTDIKYVCGLEHNPDVDVASALNVYFCYRCYTEMADRLWGLLMSVFGTGDYYAPPDPRGFTLEPYFAHYIDIGDIKVLDTTHVLSKGQTKLEDHGVTCG